MKFCSACGETKPLEAFYKNAHRGTQGRQSYCVPCFNVRQKAYYERTKAWRIPAMVQRTRTRKLGALGVEEGTACAICGAKPDDPRNGTYKAYGKTGYRKLSIDHDHQTGVIRGFLCHLCNAGLGVADDDPALLRKMADYLEAASRLADAAPNNN